MDQQLVARINGGGAHLRGHRAYSLLAVVPQCPASSLCVDGNLEAPTTATEALRVAEDDWRPVAEQVLDVVDSQRCSACSPRHGSDSR